MSSIPSDLQAFWLLAAPDQVEGLVQTEGWLFEKHVADRRLARADVFLVDGSKVGRKDHRANLNSHPARCKDGFHPPGIAVAEGDRSRPVGKVKNIIIGPRVAGGSSETLSSSDSIGVDGAFAD